MGCSCSCEKYRPKYKHHVRAIYENRKKTRDLVKYANDNPTTWPKIGAYLLKQIRADVGRESQERVETGMKGFNEMLQQGNAQDLQYYVDFVTDAIRLMLQQRNSAYVSLGTKLLSTLMPLSHRILDGGIIDEFFRELQRLSEIADSDAKLKCEVLQTLKKLVQHTEAARVCDHMQTIVPLMLGSMDRNSGNNEIDRPPDLRDEGSETQTNDADVLARRCWEEICRKVDLQSIQDLLRSLFEYVRQHRWQPPDFPLSLMKTVQKLACTGVGLKPSNYTLVKETLNELRKENAMGARITILRIAGVLGDKIQSSEECNVRHFIKIVRKQICDNPDLLSFEDDERMFSEHSKLAEEGKNAIVLFCRGLQSADIGNALLEITSGLSTTTTPNAMITLLEATVQVAAARPEFPGSFTAFSTGSLQNSISESLRSLLQCQRETYLGRRMVCNKPTREEVMLLCQKAIQNLLLSPGKNRSKDKRDTSAKARRFEALLKDSADGLPENQVSQVLRPEQRRWLYAVLFDDLIDARSDSSKLLTSYWLTILMCFLSCDANSGKPLDHLPLLVAFCIQLQEGAKKLQSDERTTARGTDLNSFILSLLLTATRICPNVPPVCQSLHGYLNKILDTRRKGHEFSASFNLDNSGLLVPTVDMQGEHPTTDPIRTLLDREEILELLREHYPEATLEYTPDADIDRVMRDEFDGEGSTTNLTETRRSAPKSGGSPIMRATPEPDFVDGGGLELGLENAHDFAELAFIVERQCQAANEHTVVFLESTHNPSRAPKVHYSTEVQGRLDTDSTLKDWNTIAYQLHLGEMELEADARVTIAEILAGLSIFRDADAVDESPEKTMKRSEKAKKFMQRKFKAIKNKFQKGSQKIKNQVGKAKKKMVGKSGEEAHGKQDRPRLDSDHSAEEVARTGRIELVSN